MDDKKNSTIIVDNENNDECIILSDPQIVD